MVRPTANVLALLELLQTGRTYSAVKLARSLDVDERTVRRYMDRLADLDVPVESTRGRYGGFRLARSFRLPPLMFNDDEAVAVVWALLCTARSSTGPASQLDIETATVKVRRVLPPALAQRIEAIVQTVTFTARTGKDGVAEPSTGRRPHFSAEVLLKSGARRHAPARGHLHVHTSTRASAQGQPDETRYPVRTTTTFRGEEPVREASGWRRAAQVGGLVRSKSTSAGRQHRGKRSRVCCRSFDWSSGASLSNQRQRRP